MVTKIQGEQPEISTESQAEGGEVNQQRDATTEFEEKEKQERKKQKEKLRIKINENLITGTEYDEQEIEEMNRLYEETMKQIEEGEIIKGRVMHVTDKNVIIDIGFKSEGAVPLTEFPEPINIKVGDEVDVYLEEIENQDGSIVLSKKKADFMKVWNTIKQVFDSQEVVEGKLLRKVKGGGVVDLFGVDAFLPGSQVALRQAPNLDELINKKIKFKIIKVNKRRRNVVVSRRIVLEEERERARRAVLDNLTKDLVCEGVVKNITDYGVFVDLGGGVDGLLHITDMSWGRVYHPSELVAIGDKIKVRVLNFDEDKKRISLGMKQLTPYPWDTAKEKYPPNTKVRGKVVSITDYGIFIELEKGIEGLIHISEISWTRQYRYPSEVAAIGDIIEAVVLDIDVKNEKMALGMKQLEPDPWLTMDEKYPAGTRITGKVRNIANFGVFVEIEEGIDGLIHISDLSWLKRIRHPAEILNKGDTVEVVVLNVDKENRRISLGLKQITEDPWEDIVEKYPVGTELKGKISKLLDRGVLVMIEKEVEGFVPFSHLGQEEIYKPSDSFEINDELPLKVIGIDSENRRMILSVKAYFEGRERAELEEYLKKYQVKKPITVSEIVEETLPEELKEKITPGMVEQPKESDEIPKSQQLSEEERIELSSETTTDGNKPDKLHEEGKPQ